jgi:ribosome-binding factor A
MKSQRQLQIGETIKRMMSDIFLRGDILNLSGSYVTILEADVSPDAKNVRIFIDIFGQEEKHPKIIEKLNEAAPHFRYQLAKKVTLRIVPEITFVLDKTGQNALRLETLISKEASKYNAPQPKQKKTKTISRKKNDD